MTGVLLSHDWLLRPDQPEGHQIDSHTEMMPCGLSAQGQVADLIKHVRSCFLPFVLFCFKVNSCPGLSRGVKGPVPPLGTGWGQRQLEPTPALQERCPVRGCISSPSSSDLRSKLPADASVLGYVVGTPNSGCSALGSRQRQQTRPTYCCSWYLPLRGPHGFVVPFFCLLLR